MPSKTIPALNQEILRTKRLELRPLTSQNQQDLFELDSNPAVMKYIGYGKPLSASDSEIGLSCMLDLAVYGLGTWTGYVGSEFVGWWVLAAGETPDTSTSPQVDTQNVVFGLKLLPKFWGRGYAKEGTREIFRHAFQDLGVEQISGDAMAVNKGSRAAMATCGMKYIRTFHNVYPTPPPGIEEGEVEYRITKDDWLSQEGGPK
ncbi:GNAT domain-containing protein [Rhexocercosporidium sp. MPI-PUGE-AT-0058]|nr:GNAT domain-containing protein [Rhexocercosporidium sp. MPI-PUGE-AT-0058]